MPTNDTSGPLFTHSSPSAALQSSLESRLRARLDGTGSPEFVFRWKSWDMRWAGPICALRASARRTSASDCTGWPTARAKDGKGASTRSPGKERPVGDYDLPTAAELVGWPTPDASVAQDGEGLETWLARREKLKAKKINGNGCGTPLSMAAQMAGWATPCANDSKSHRNETANRLAGRDHHTGQTLADQTSGLLSTSSPAGTARHAALNPEFVRWLMGFPAGWLCSGAWATPSSRKSPRRS